MRKLGSRANLHIVDSPAFDSGLRRRTRPSIRRSRIKKSKINNARVRGGPRRGLERAGIFRYANSVNSDRVVHPEFIRRARNSNRNSTRNVVSAYRL